MSKLFSTFLLVFLVSCTQEPEVFTGPLPLKDGITYHQNMNKPVTGIVESYYENGNLFQRTIFIEGKREGLEEVFHENGQLWFKGNFKDGKREDGIQEQFHENGNLSRRTTYRDGKPNGPTEMFYPNGELMKRGNFVDGKIENPEEWYKQ